MIDSQIIKEAVDYAADPNTRGAFLTGFILAFGLGCFAGVLSCKFLYELSRLIVFEIRGYIQRKDRLRNEARERKKNAAKRRLEAYERRKNEKRWVQGVLWDRKGNAYCPVCERGIQPFEYSNHYSSSVTYCYACNKEFFCHTKNLEEEVRKKWEE